MHHIASHAETVKQTFSEPRLLATLGRDKL